MSIHAQTAIGGIFLFIIIVSACSVKSSLLSGYETCDDLVSATKENSKIPIHLFISLNIFCTSEQRNYLQKYKAIE